MSTPTLDPSLPENSPFASGEMRGQFQASQNRPFSNPRTGNLPKAAPARPAEAAEKLRLTPAMGNGAMASLFHIGSLEGAVPEPPRLP